MKDFRLDLVDYVESLEITDEERYYTVSYVDEGRYDHLADKEIIMPEDLGLSVRYKEK